MLKSNPYPDNITDQELVALTLQEKENYEHLMQRYEAKLLRYIIRLARVGEEDAKDILQEVFIKAYKNLNEYNAGFSFSSWIYRIAHNEAVSYLRKLSARPKVIKTEDNDILLNMLAKEPDFEIEIDKKYLSEEIGKILNRLDNKYREVIILKFLEERNYKEISDIIKKPAGTVATLISRAKKRLRDEIIRGHYSF